MVVSSKHFDLLDQLWLSRMSKCYGVLPKGDKLGLQSFYLIVPVMQNCISGMYFAFIDNNSKMLISWTKPSS